jgi:hypothetical protein
MGELGSRFWTELALAGSAAALGFVTLIWRDWIEVVFRVDPDRGSGATEWLVVAILVSGAIGLGQLARNERRRAHSPA